MSRFEEYKRKIFPTADSQSELLIAVMNICADVPDFDTAYATLFDKTRIDDVQLQKILAPFLRALAMNHLDNDQFRQIYAEGPGSFDDETGDFPRAASSYIQRQKQNYTYAMVYEMLALAEIFGVNLSYTMVTPATFSPRTNAPTVLHRSDSANALTVHLFYIERDHYFIHERNYGSTVGDGNCFYNGFAQFLAEFITLESSPIEAQKLAIAQKQQELLNAIGRSEATTLADLIANRIKRPTTTPIERSDQEFAYQMAGDNNNKDGQSGNDVGQKPPVAQNNPPPPNPGEPITASFFLQVMAHPATKITSTILVIAGLIALSIGLLCLCPATAPLMLSLGIALSQASATTLAIAGSSAAAVGSVSKGLSTFFSAKVQPGTVLPTPAPDHKQRP